MVDYIFLHSTQIVTDPSEIGEEFNDLDASRQFGSEKLAKAREVQCCDEK